MRGPLTGPSPDLLPRHSSLQRGVFRSQPGFYRRESMVRPRHARGKGWQASKREGKGKRVKCAAGGGGKAWKG